MPEDEDEDARLRGRDATDSFGLGTNRGPGRSLRNVRATEEALAAQAALATDQALAQEATELAAALERSRSTPRYTPPSESAAVRADATYGGYSTLGRAPTSSAAPPRPRGETERIEALLAREAPGLSQEEQARRRALYGLPPREPAPPTAPASGAVPATSAPASPPQSATSSPETPAERARERLSDVSPTVPSRPETPAGTPVTNAPQSNAVVTSPQATADRSVQTRLDAVQQARTELNADLNRVQNTPLATTPEQREQQTQARTASVEEAGRIVARTANENNAETQRRSLGVVFQERNEQTFYHDFIIYVQGVDVTPYVVGSVSVSLGVNDSPNTATFTLVNTGDLFTLTPENLAGTWRLTPNAPFSEYAKKRLYDFKNDVRRNPYDHDSGNRRWQLLKKSPLFHRMDPVRIWVHNPMTEGDEWLPIFTGYLEGKQTEFEYAQTTGMLSMSASDIRELMRGMRVQRNTIQSAEVRQVSELGPVAEGSQRATRRDVALLSDALFTRAAARIRESRRPGNTPLTTEQALQACNDALLAATGNATGMDLLGDFFRDYIPDQSNYAFAWAKMSFTQISHAMTVGGNTRVEAHAVNKPGANQTEVAAQAAGTGRPNAGTERGILKDSIGRMREGLTYLYPDPDENRTSGRSATQVNADILERWHRLCLFGSPVRRDCAETNLQTRLAPSVDPADCRFWTEEEVHFAGRLSHTDGVWAPDMQLVHWLLPRQGDGTGTDGLFEVTVLGSDGNTNTNVRREWTDRLSFLIEVMNPIDYRMWVTGAGDIVFEFPMYDFYPEDFGSFAPVFRADSHLLNTSFDDEHQDYPTVVLVQGTFTGYNLGGAPVNAGTDLLKPPSGIAMSLALSSRRGFRIDTSNTFPFIKDPKKLQKIATLIMQRELMKADSFAVSLAYRIFVTPNRPLHEMHVDRIGLITNLSHAWEIDLEATTNVDLQGSRAVDPFGIRRSLTGGRSLPISFAQIPGADTSNNTIRGRLTLQQSVQELRLAGFSPNEIVYGVLSGTQLLPPPAEPGQPPGEARSLSRGQLAAFRQVQSSLALPGRDADGNVRGGRQRGGNGGIVSIEEQRQRLRDGNRVTAEEILNRAVSLDVLGGGEVDLNVVPGFQLASVNEAAGARAQEDLPSSMRAYNEEIASQPAPGIPPPYTDATRGPASGIVNPSAGSPPEDVRTLRIRTGPNGASLAQATAYNRRLVDTRRIIFGCEGCSPRLDWLRRMLEAGAAAFPSWPERRLVMAIALMGIETAQWNSVFNNNVGNIIVRPNDWQGDWVLRDVGDTKAEFAAYPSLRDGWVDWYAFLQANRGAYATALRELNRNDLSWALSLYNAGYSSTLLVEKLGREAIALLPRLPDGQIDTGSTEYQIARKLAVGGAVIPGSDGRRTGQWGDYLVLYNSLARDVRAARTAPRCDPTQLASREAQAAELLRQSITDEDRERARQINLRGRR